MARKPALDRLSSKKGKKFLIDTYGDKAEEILEQYIDSLGPLDEYDSTLLKKNGIFILDIYQMELIDSMLRKEKNCYDYQHLYRDLIEKMNDYEDEEE